MIMQVISSMSESREKNNKNQNDMLLNLELHSIIRIIYINTCKLLTVS